MGKNYQEFLQKKSLSRCLEKEVESKALGKATKLIANDSAPSAEIDSDHGNSIQASPLFP